MGLKRYWIVQINRIFAIPFTSVKSSVGIITHQSHISKVGELGVTQSITYITFRVSCDAINEIFSGSSQHCFGLLKISTLLLISQDIFRVRSNLFGQFILCCLFLSRSAAAYHPAAVYRPNCAAKKSNITLCIFNSLVHYIYLTCTALVRLHIEYYELAEFTCCGKILIL